jgi:hypothetical protein
MNPTRTVREIRIRIQVTRLRAIVDMGNERHMSDPETRAPTTGQDSASAPEYIGADGRDAHVTDRRRTSRGGRRLADRVSQLARFLHDLLTETPR